MAQNVQKTIDIEKVLRSKMGSKVKYVPRFVISWLKRLAHEDEVNAFLWENRDKEGTPWLEACVKYLDMDVSIEGEENLPDKHDGKLYTFVSNHPLGGQDGVCLGAIVGRRYDGKFRYLVNDLLMFLPGLRPVCIGINKTGRQARDFPRIVETGFRSDNHILMFPAGLNSRLVGGRIHDLPWKKTFVTKSVQYQRDVVPIYFSGHNSKRFYRIAKWQKMIGLKVNIAMLFLVDEMYKNRHKHFRVVVGKPIPWQTFDSGKKAVEWAKYVEDRVYEQAGTLGLRAE
ncbi:glycerol acyltransferase [Prevotella sp. S7-1-8]|uniref:glycerol acyltransferase n=1 Tax=Prevotella sp. S7-1-8 TaxID=1284775 RepID=UPI00050EF7F9|nr:glycerol acyltransferase [Prevotella sp. S7-1-8]KGF16801.1 glycerol acyltransferase [Prevotella sp. S7-1-8]